MDIEKLFKNDDDYIRFLNLKAKGRIITLENAIAFFEKDIHEALEQCSEVFTKYNARTNFISEMLTINEKISAIEGQKYNAAEMNELSSEKEALYLEYEDFLAQIPELKFREDLEFNKNKIFDRKQRIDEARSLINEIDHEFKDARTTDVEDAFDTIPVLVDIRNYLSFSNSKTPDTEEIKPEDTTIYPHVIKITKASEALLKKVHGEQNDESSELYSNNTSLNNDDFDIFLNNNTLDKTPQAESSASFSEPLFDPFKPLELEPKQEDLSTSIQNQDTESKDIVSLLDQDAKNSAKKPVTHTIKPGQSLTKIAKRVYFDENYWFNLYNANKDIIDERLRERNISHDEPFESNEILFDGLNIVIPNNYEERKVKSLAS